LKFARGIVAQRVPWFGDVVGWRQGPRNALRAIREIAKGSSDEHARRLLP
jgi:hypothetical protein